MRTDRELDLVVYGATGYTGRLVAEYLHQQYGEGGELNWAIAGRSEDKLRAVRDELGISENLPLVMADASDPDTLHALAARTAVVLTTVGPYQHYGSELVAACAAAGTDYVDLCGEPGWMHEMINAHQKTAEESGARIVFSCGFDSVPFDLGVFFLQQAAKARFGHTLPRVRGRVRAMKGTFSGGTLASLNATLKAASEQPELVKVLIDPFALTPGFSGPQQPPGNKPLHDEDLDSWAAPFVMAAINTKNIHRSNFLLDAAYGKDFVYDEMLLTGPGEKGEAAAQAVAADKSMAGSDRKPGEGPSPEERESGYYDLLFVGSSDAGERLLASVRGDRDPGYGSTSKMIAESALCLLKNPGLAGGGIWTPAPAFGEALIERLQSRAGLTFSLES
jgi:short subunit dehydrogenase-like uncharacterized protein